MRAVLVEFALDIQSMPVEPLLGPKDRNVTRIENKSVTGVSTSVTRATLPSVKHGRYAQSHEALLVD